MLLNGTLATRNRTHHTRPGPAVKKTTLPAVVQSNQVVQASYSLTLAEKRLILLALTKIESYPNEPAAIVGERIIITAEDVTKGFRLTQKQTYELLQEASRRLYDRTVIIDRPDPDDPRIKQTRTRWISAIDYIQGNGQIALWIAPRIMPYLTQLKGEFVKYQIEQVAAMSSVYAIRLYELLLQWGKTGNRYIEVAELKRLFQLENEYNRIERLKARVIDPAVKQINAHTSFTASYTNRKAGRNVIGLDFTFGVKPTEQAPKTTTKPAAKTSPKDPTTTTKPPRKPRSPEQQAKAETALAEAKRGLR
jgi:plasmid replication initiation protein